MAGWLVNLFEEALEKQRQAFDERVSHMRPSVLWREFFQPERGDDMSDQGKVNRFRGNKLVLMMGLPYSGKSTEAATLSHTLEAPIVCPDEIRVALHGKRYAQEAEPMVWTIARIMVRSLFLAGHEWAILDATNTTRKRRDEWRRDGWRTYIYEVQDGSYGTKCIRRAREREDEEIEPVIRRMFHRYEKPGNDEDLLREALRSHVTTANDPTDG